MNIGWWGQILQKRRRKDAFNVMRRNKREVNKFTAVGCIGNKVFGIFFYFFTFVFLGVTYREIISTVRKKGMSHLTRLKEGEKTKQKGGNDFHCAAKYFRLINKTNKGLFKKV